MSATVLIVTNSVTLLTGVALGYAISTVLTRRGLKEMENVEPKPKTEKRPRRRFGRVDIILAILMFGFIFSTYNSVSSNARSTQALEEAASAARSAERTSQETSDVVTCLESYSNALADALQRRNDDNALLQKADAARDVIVVELLMASVDPSRSSAVPGLSRALADATGKKQEALRQVQEGRKEKTYPEAPREVCPDVR